MAEEKKEEYKNIDDVLLEDIYQLVTSEPVIVRSALRLHDAILALLGKPQPTSGKVYVVDEERRLLGTVTLETILRQVE